MLSAGVEMGFKNKVIAMGETLDSKSFSILMTYLVLVATLERVAILNTDAKSMHFRSDVVDGSRVFDVFSGLVLETQCFSGMAGFSGCL